MLQAGRIDIVATIQSNNEHLFRDHFAKAPLTDTLTNPRYVSLARASKYASVFEHLNDAMTRDKTSGKIDDYFARYATQQFNASEPDSPQ